MLWSGCERFVLGLRVRQAINTANRHSLGYFTDQPTHRLSREPIPQVDIRWMSLEIVAYFSESFLFETIGICISLL